MTREDGSRYLSEVELEVLPCQVPLQQEPFQEQQGGAGHHLRGDEEEVGGGGEEEVGGEEGGRT